MRFPRVYPILDTETLAQHGIALDTAAAALLEGGAGILQVRQKGHWTRQVFESARQVACLCREAGAVLVVNDRADFAMLLEGGLHIGQEDLAPRDARKLIGPDALLGFSSHNLEQLSAAGGEPVDYVALGPVYPTSSKHNPDPVVGVDEVRRLRPLIDKPLVAIGGITRANAAGAFNAGADSVAVISDLVPQCPTARSLRERMEEWQRIAARI
ncbi:MAG: thiamine phosphate synthase [Acidobacteriota bacterium]|jgi:thiamine-phosphate pyrophosphorylase|nr:thiamine phosphate synthase [Acidobacteriota bacterium]